MQIIAKNLLINRAHDYTILRMVEKSAWSSRGKNELKLGHKKPAGDRTRPKELSMNTRKKSTSLPKDVQKGAPLLNTLQTAQSLPRTPGISAHEQQASRNQPSSPPASWSTREGVSDARLLTLKEAADRLAISLPTIRSWVWQRKIEIVKIGRCVRIREQVISELILKSTIPPRAEP